MNREKWAEKFKIELEKQGIAWRAEPCNHKFRGIGGRVHSKEKVFWPVGIGHVNGEIASAQVPHQDMPLGVPFLINRRSQAQLGIHIHTEDGTCDIDALGIKHYKLLTYAEGLWAVNLLDFARDGHPGVDGQQGGRR